jgi:hypothetical protein
MTLEDIDVAIKSLTDDKLFQMMHNGKVPTKAEMEQLVELTKSR